MLEDFKHLKLWNQYEKKTLPTLNLDNLFNDKLALLDRYYLAFPKYTLHNRQHQKNILQIIGDLLGDDIEKLSSLELAIIILTTVFHDIGMVFTENELKNIQNEDTFRHFLDGNFKAKLIFNESNFVLTKDLAQWYCRWMHAKRVWLFLNDLEKYKWGAVSLKNPVGFISESHNDDAVLLINDEKFNTDYLGEADLRFCAILLRLADILDFDNSRAPQSVYELLDLDNPKNQNEQISKEEWNKHLSSDGFKIVYNQGEIKLRFIAGPKHPQIEKNIQTFLDIIEDELKKCITIIKHSSDRWRDFKLPFVIDRTGINSDNYKKGNYRLSLDENQIIKLLTGENLYDNEFVFIRELLQNAIDSSRMREYHEMSKGNNDFKASPIEVSIWIDDEGYRWVRVDDYGMGINEYVIENHLLKKGNSYYNSDYFKIQKLYFKDKTGKEFTPISRFGIGLLSCFILGDAIEINTKSVAIAQTNSAEEKIRLSIQGLQSQYIIQIEKDKHDPIEMPKQHGNEKGFRQKEGTSIAVRINRTKDFLGFDKSFKYFLNSYVYCSPVEIKLLGENVGLSFYETLSTPLTVLRFYPFSAKEKEEIEKLLRIDIKDEIGIEIIPIDISKNAASTNLQGQLVFIRLLCEQFNDPAFESDFKYDFVIQKLNDQKTIRFKKDIWNPKIKKNEEQKVEIDISECFQDAFNDFVKEEILVSDFDSYYQNRKIRLIHNGITVPNYRGNFNYKNAQKLSFLPNLFSYGYMPHYLHEMEYTYFGIVYLQDILIPDLSVARNIIKRLDFRIYSNFFYATREMNKYVDSSLKYNYLDNIDEIFTFREVIDDDLFQARLWDDEKCIYVEKGILSIGEIKSRLQFGQIKVEIPRGRFLETLTKGLLQINFNVEYFAQNESNGFFLIKSIRDYPFSQQPIDQFPPFTFVPFNDETIVADANLINANHALGQWILSNQTTLIEDFLGYISSLVRFIRDGYFDGINEVLEHFKNILPEKQKPTFHKITKDDYLNLPNVHVHYHKY